MEDLKSSDPQELGDFLLLKRIGAGGFGVVYLASDRVGQRVALKVLRPEFADDPRLRERLFREARSLSSVKGVRTAKLIGVGTTDSHAFLAMEYVPGESLDKIVQGERRPEGPMLWFLALGLVEALEEIHAAGIIHRDLKPSNVIVGPDGVKVVDFGISAILDDGGFTQTGTMMGTATWLSPEQINGAPVDERSDIFSLGMLLAYIGLGHHPFGDGRPDAVMYRIANTRPDLSALPGPFRLAVTRCLSRNASERPTLEALRAFFASGGSSSSEVALHEGNNAESTFVVQPTDMSLATEMSRSVAATTGNNAQPRRPRPLIGAAALLGIGLGVAATLDATNAADLGVIVAPEGTGGRSETPTTSQVPPTTLGVVRTTTTTQAPPPAFKIQEYDGVQVRWNPCDMPINIVLNTAGNLTTTQEAAIARFLSETAFEITEMTELVVLYSGTTTKKTNDLYRSGEEILIQIDAPGQGLLAASESDSLGTWVHSVDRRLRGFQEIDGVDIHINSNVFLNYYMVGPELKAQAKRILMQYLGAAMGLAVLDDTDMNGFGIEDPKQMVGEVMYVGSSAFTSQDPTWGPGDRIGMMLVGASNECFG